MNNSMDAYTGVRRDKRPASSTLSKHSGKPDAGVLAFAGKKHQPHAARFAEVPFLLKQ
jgi:hypothetical protein